MSEPLPERIIRTIGQVPELYHRLLLVVAPSGSGKTAALREVSERWGHPYINVNLELSRGLLDLTERQRSLEVEGLLGAIVPRGAAQVALLDNLELLFDVSLKLDPLRCLQGLARHRTVVAAWNGRLDDDHLLYAEPWHREYRRYAARGILIVSP